VVKIGYLGERVKRAAPEPYLDPPAADEGVAGARLGVSDDNTTGRFNGQQFALTEALLPEGGDVAAAFRQLAGDGVRLVVADLPEASLLAVAALPEAHDVTLLNIAAPDDDLRAGKCRANVLHILPSRNMLADALLEYLIVKQWRNVFLVVGPTDGDRAYAAAMKRAITKYGAKLVAEKPWTFQPGARRSDSGHYAIAAEVANFTQGVSYDVLIVADEDGQFGDYMSYATYTPRPVAGTAGLVPTAWARPHEEWGATQLQDRFRHADKRWMTERDYAGWLAVRAVGEAAARAQSAAPE
jgi:ABC transporter substrate binding protein (PQQ-dependent alcohol dehydrogenase system)